MAPSTEWAAMLNMGWLLAAKDAKRLVWDRALFFFYAHFAKMSSQDEVWLILFLIMPTSDELRTWGLGRSVRGRDNLPLQAPSKYSQVSRTRNDTELEPGSKKSQGRRWREEEKVRSACLDKKRRQTMSSTGAAQAKELLDKQRGNQHQLSLPQPINNLRMLLV